MHLIFKLIRLICFCLFNKKYNLIYFQIEWTDFFCNKQKHSIYKHEQNQTHVESISSITQNESPQIQKPRRLQIELSRWRRTLHVTWFVTNSFDKRHAQWVAQSRDEIFKKFHQMCTEEENRLHRHRDHILWLS